MLNLDMDNTRTHLDLVEIFRLVYQHKIKIVTLSLCRAVVMVGASYFVMSQFRSEVIMQPVTQIKTPSMGRISSLSGVAPLAGVSLGSDLDVESSLAFLESRSLAREFIEQNGLMKIIYADQYNDAKDKYSELIGLTICPS
ncbi:hypothetical protein [Paremcibacter congregatus]|uniref:hypothetical protein n=1 Tax=Paremcibacter congregatus TaxID=2043170 RepID=UPI003A92F8E9